MWIQSVFASEIHCIERLRKYQKIHFIKISKNLPLTLIKHEIVECLMARRVSKDENKNTKWENNRDKYGYMTLKIWKKTVITVRNKQCNVCSHMIYLQFAFKDTKYARNIVFCWYSEILKSWMVVFLTLNICRRFRIWVISSSQWIMSSVSIFWVIWGKVTQTREATDSWGLHKNRNCAFL